MSNKSLIVKGSLLRYASIFDDKKPGHRPKLDSEEKNFFIEYDSL